MKRLVFISIFLSCSYWVSAQTISHDSLTKLVTPIIKTQVEAELEQIKYISGVALGTLSLLGIGFGIYLWFWKIKKIAEKAVSEKVDKIVEEQIARKFGVRSELINAYFREIEQVQPLKRKRILVISKTCGKRDTIVKAIEKAGFSAAPIFKNLSEYNEGIDTNHFDLILFDNEDATLEEAEITAIVDKYEQAFKFVCFSAVNFSDDNYKKYISKVRFMKDINNMDFALMSALKS